MAGDWIKVEHATAHKPEVMVMAELLGVPRREMVGILVDFLVWLDSNARHANVTHVSRKGLDDVLHCAGLSAALEAVEWVKWDDAARTMTIANYERHNGTSAKNRGLATERKRNQRSREGHGKSVTREEREKNTTPIVPDGFAAFWLIYPRKDKKLAAEQAWKRLAPDGELQQRIGADVRRRTAGLDWTKEGGAFIPLPASYLNARRWEDEGTALPAPGNDGWRKAL